MNRHILIKMVAQFACKIRIIHKTVEQPILERNPEAQRTWVAPPTLWTFPVMEVVPVMNKRCEMER